jgi:hypothetical protein
VDRDYQSIFSYLTSVNLTENEDIVLSYYKHHQTPAYFKLVLAAIGGLQILRTSQKLIEIVVKGQTTHYIFESDTLHVDYEHEALVVGSTYPANFVIGNGVEVFYSDGSDKAWWRQVDWRGGLSLDPLINIRGMNLLDKETVAYVAGQDAGSVDGSKVHARIKLGGDFEEEKRYWESVAAREKASGIYLNRLLKLSEEVDSGDPTVLDTFQKLVDAYEDANEINALFGNPKEAPDVEALPSSGLVNALDVYFQAVIGVRGFVVLLRPEGLKNLKGVLALYPPRDVGRLHAGHFRLWPERFGRDGQHWGITAIY